MECKWSELHVYFARTRFAKISNQQFIKNNRKEPQKLNQQ